MTTTQAAPAEAPTAADPAGDQRLIPITELARRLGIGVSTAERQLAAGKLPSPRRIGRCLRWNLAEVLAWLDRPKSNGELMNQSEWAVVWAALVKRRN